MSPLPYSSFDRLQAKQQRDIAGTGGLFGQHSSHAFTAKIRDADLQGENNPQPKTRLAKAQPRELTAIEWQTVDRHRDRDKSDPWNNIGAFGTSQAKATALSRSGNHQATEINSSKNVERSTERALSISDPRVKLYHSSKGGDSSTVNTR